MPRSDVERLMERIELAPEEVMAADLRALLRAAERMRLDVTDLREFPTQAAQAYDRAKARILGGKPRG